MKLIERPRCRMRLDDGCLVLHDHVEAHDRVDAVQMMVRVQVSRRLQRFIGLAFGQRRADDFQSITLSATEMR